MTTPELPAPGATAKLAEWAPNILTICTEGGKLLVTIKPDGSLVYGDSYTPDGAARAFWGALAWAFQGRATGAADADAARYRWLTQHANGIYWDIWNSEAAQLPIEEARDRLNAAIDAAIAARSGKECHE